MFEWNGQRDICNLTAMNKVVVKLKHWAFTVSSDVWRPLKHNAISTEQAKFGRLKRQGSQIGRQETAVIGYPRESYILAC